MAFKVLDINITWVGDGIDEKGIDSNTGDVLVEVDEKYFRPTEVDLLIGDSTKAKTMLGWSPKYGVEELCKEMVYSDFNQISRNNNLKEF